MQQSRLFATPGMDVGEVARVGFRGWKKRQVLVIPGTRNHVMAILAQRLVPRAYIRKVTKRLNANA
jgi:hypothetical protein